MSSGVFPGLGPERATRMRWGVAVGLALAALVSYLTRVCLSNAATAVQAEFQVTNTEMGRVLGAFFLGYFFFQVPTGALANRFGTRIVLPALSALWSLTSIWMGMAWSISSLYASRVAMGVFQAGLVPCAGRAVSDWIPDRERGFSSSLIAGSMSAGAVLATGLTALLMKEFSWRIIFCAYSLVGVVWAIGFYAFFRNRPEEHPRANAAELDLIRPAGAAPKPAPPVSNLLLAGKMALSISVWLLCLQAICRAFGAAFYLTWFVAFLEKSRGVHATDAGAMNMIPLAGSTIGALIGGLVVDAVLRRTGSRWWSRSGVSTLALLACAASSLAATRMESPVLLSMTLAGGSFFLGVGSPATWAACLDVSGRHASIVFAVMNMAGNIGAYLSPTVIGGLFDAIEKQGLDWNLVLYVFAGVYLAGAFVWATINPSRKLEPEPAA